MFANLSYDIRDSENVNSQQIMESFKPSKNAKYIYAVSSENISGAGG